MDKALLILALLMFIPVGLIGRRYPVLRQWTARLVGFAPFPSISVSFAYQMDYRGYERGFELALFDLAVISLALSMSWKDWSPALRKARWLYFLVAASSLTYALQAQYTLFALHHLSLVYLAFVVTAHAVNREDLGPYVLQGLCAGVCFATATALQQRYVYGYFQTPGPFDHQNGLPMAANMVFPAALALTLAGQGGKLAPTTVVAAALGAVLSLSRGGMAMFVAATGLVVLGSLLRGITQRKVVVVGGMMVGGLAVVLKGLDTIIERFVTASPASAHARDEFEKLAAAMLRDHPLGVGMNNYSYANAMGYGEAGGLPPIDIGGIVHNAYWLQLAELGMLGLFAYVVVHFTPALIGCATAARDKGILGDIALGLAAGVIVTMLQGQLEWATVSGKLNRVLWLVFAVLLGIHQQSKRRRSS